MTKKIFTLLFALLFVAAAANFAVAHEDAQPVAQEVAVQTAAPCMTCGSPNCCDPYCAPVVYRRGLLGFCRPVIARPVVVAPAPVVVRPVVVAPAYPRYVYRGWYRW